MGIVYLNGKYLENHDAFVSVDDRGFLFADACYEATPSYGGHFLLLGRHLDRLQTGLDVLRIGFDTADLRSVHHELLERNGLSDVELALVYTQVTRGVAPRGHAFPTGDTPPTVYAFAREMKRATDDDFERGTAAITRPDIRWHRTDIKTTGLLPNVLAQQAAVEAGVKDVVFHRDGIVTEGTLNNIFVVISGVLTTAPADNQILHGITRQLIIDLALKSSIAMLERHYTIDELMDADEVFFSGSTTEIRPTVAVDGQPIGDGSPGTVTRQIRDLFNEFIESSAAGA